MINVGVWTYLWVEERFAALLLRDRTTLFASGSYESSRRTFVMHVGATTNAWHRNPIGFLLYHTVVVDIEVLVCPGDERLKLLAEILCVAQNSELARILNKHIVKRLSSVRSRREHGIRSIRLQDVVREHLGI